MPTDQPILPLHLLKEVLKRMVEVHAELLNLIEEELEKSPDTDPMDRVVEMLREDGVEGWAQIYNDPANQIKAPWLSILPPGKFNAMAAALSALSPAEQSAWIERIYREGEASIQALAEMDAVEIQAHWPDFMNSDVDRLWLQGRYSCVMATFFSNLAAMQTGKTMFQLVAEAKGGDDDSFVKAVQMDKTVLEFVPYFKERSHRAAEQGEIAFLRRVHEHRNKPLTVTRLQYAKLWLLFDALDNMNVLDQFEQDLSGFAELCQELRVYGPHPTVGAVDLEDFASRLKDFRRSHRQSLPRSGSSVLVKDVSSSNSPP